MITIGILGGIASGKSVVSDEFRHLGAAVLDADRAGHEVLRMQSVKDAVRSHFGDSVMTASGEVDRRQLADIVFATTPHAAEELKYLEQLTHPEIRKRLLAELDELHSSGRCPAAILDAPILLKAGWDDFCDKIVYVDAPRHMRLTRALARGWSEHDFSAREAAQESLETKLRHADFIVDNSGSLESTRAQIERLWSGLFS